MGFISGKHHNRCTSLLPLLATAMQLLHFGSFLASGNNLLNFFVDMMEKLQAYSSPTNLTDFEITQLCQDTMFAHERSSNDT